MQQVQQMSAQLASMSVAPQPGAPSPAQLSEGFYLERERAAERERQAERERHETRMVAAFAVGTCTCGLGAAIVGAALLLKKG